MAVACLALLAATRRLWIPHDHVAQVPLAFFASGVPDGFQWTALVLMIASIVLAAASAAPRLVRATLLLFVASASLLVLADQARLQPWAYEFAVLALLLALAPDAEALRLVRFFIASFYVYSALTKLDYAFLHTLGQQFLSALAASAGASIDDWSERTRITAALIFPVGELVVGVGLLIARTRAIALGLALVLHVLLLVILGPWGLAHKPGVLLWNAYFIVQDLIVFWPLGDHSVSALPPATQPSPRSIASAAARGVAVAVIALPLLGPTTWFDLWPSWGLYSASAERTLLLVHRLAVEDLPTELQAFSKAGGDTLEPWVSLRFDRWVLESLDAPVYPQNRYQLAIATALVDRHGLANRARIVRLGLADRWTGERTTSVLASPAEFQAATHDYVLNARSRPARSAAERP